MKSRLLRRPNWLPPIRWRWPELGVLASVLTIAGSASIFIWVADEVASGETHQFDNWVIESLRDPQNPRLPRGPLWMIDAARDLTSLGSPVVLTLVVTIVAGYLCLSGRLRATGLLVAAVSSGALLSWVMKSAFARPRPPMGSMLQGTLTSSFPSGHSLVSAVVYLTLGAMLARFEARRWTKLYVISVAVLLALVVGATRMYLGVHYPSDVLAGWAAGAGWALCWWLIARYAWNRSADAPQIQK